jgi:membrane associated rhomboid family serine protease
MDSGQKAMFWMLPLLWPFMDFPNSLWQVCAGCRALTTFLALCVGGYVLQNFAPFLNLNRFFSFYAPCMKKGEFWRLFTYFMLHSDLQHLCINLMHLLDALDLEGVPDLEVSLGVPLRCTRDGPIASICYPDVGIGRIHLIAVIGTVLAYGALLGTIKNFGALVQGASSVCFGVDGALIALYAMFLGAGLDQQLKIPEFGAFFWMRIGIIAFHIIIDVVQSLCGAGKDTVGTMAHMASLVAGFCYVILVLPPMGDGSLFDSQQPYIVNCGITSPAYVTMESATTQCVAFFRRGNGMEVATAQKMAIAILGGGVFISVVNAILKRHISDDGIACCSCGETPAPKEETESPDKALMSLRQQQVSALREDVTRLERLLQNMPSLAGMGSPGNTPAAVSGDNTHVE